MPAANRTILRQFVAATRALILAVAVLAGGASAASDLRVALVIGNGAYADAPLKNPVNDARAMTRTLTELGFDVISVENADRAGMQRAMLDFGRRLKDTNGTGLFYFAGHGMQVRGNNFLIPTRTHITSEDEVEVEGVDVNYVLARMAAARNPFNIVILDACRNNPFERSFRSAANGLAAISAPTGTLIAYATAPGSLAADGDSGNGLYTGELVAAMKKPGLTVEETFKTARGGVIAMSQGRQIPWESSSLVGDFVFRPAAANVSASAEADDRALREIEQREAALREAMKEEKALREAAQRMAALPPSRTTSTETVFWNSIKDSAEISDYRAYLETYPKGSYARIAKDRVASLQNSGVSSGTGQTAGPIFEDRVNANWVAIEKAIHKHVVDNQGYYTTVTSGVYTISATRLVKVQFKGVVGETAADSGTIRVVMASHQQYTGLVASMHAGWPFNFNMTYQISFKDGAPVIGEYRFGGRYQGE